MYQISTLPYTLFLTYFPQAYSPLERSWWTVCLPLFTHPLFPKFFFSLSARGPTRSRRNSTGAGRTVGWMADWTRCSQWREIYPLCKISMIDEHISHLTTRAKYSTNRSSTLWRAKDSQQIGRTVDNKERENYEYDWMTINILFNNLNFDDLIASFGVGGFPTGQVWPTIALRSNIKWKKNNIPQSLYSNSSSRQWVLAAEGRLCQRECQNSSPWQPHSRDWLVQCSQQSYQCDCLEST